MVNYAVYTLSWRVKLLAAVAGGKKWEKFDLCTIADLQPYARNEFLFSWNIYIIAFFLFKKILFFYILYSLDKFEPCDYLAKRIVFYKIIYMLER